MPLSRFCGTEGVMLLSLLWHRRCSINHLGQKNRQIVEQFFIQRLILFEQILITVQDWQLTISDMGERLLNLERNITIQLLKYLFISCMSLNMYDNRQVKKRMQKRSGTSNCESQRTCNWFGSHKSNCRIHNPYKDQLFGTFQSH